MDRLTGKADVVEASIRKRLPDIIISDTIALQREYHCLLWFVEIGAVSGVFAHDPDDRGGEAGRGYLGNPDHPEQRQRPAH
ncbi:MAG: hypothetical protein V9G14_09880 [Cypionkella sp.]